MQTVDYMKLLRNRYNMAIRNERHRRHSIKLLSLENDVGLVAHPLLKSKQFTVDGKRITISLASNQSRTINSSTAIMRSKEAFKHAVQNLLSYLRAFEAIYGVYFVDVRIMDIVKDMMFSTFLATSSGGTNIK